MRQLTGKIEETGFNIEQMSGRLDKLISDVDFRLQQLEQGRPAAGTATAPVPGQATPAQPAPNQSNSGTPVATMMPPATASGTTDDGSVQTLGTIPQSMANQATTPAPGSPPVAGNNGVPVSAGVAAAAPVPAQPATSATPSSGSMLPAGTPADQYKYAFDLLVRHEYAAAEAAFREFVEKNGEDVLAGNAQYWLGETYYVRENFADAAIAFAEGYQTWPNSSKAPDNLLKLAMSLARVGKNDDACAAFSQLGQQFPTAPANVKRRANSEKSRLKCPT